MENEDLARALAAARFVTNNSEQEAVVLTEEAERVSAATVLAELLAPMLAEHLRSTHLGPAVAPAAVATPVLPEKSSKANPPPPKNNVPSIADLIDGMLSQQAPFPASPVRH